MDQGLERESPPARGLRPLTAYAIHAAIGATTATVGFALAALIRAISQAKVNFVVSLSQRGLTDTVGQAMNWTVVESAVGEGAGEGRGVAAVLSPGRFFLLVGCVLAATLFGTAIATVVGGGPLERGSGLARLKAYLGGAVKGAALAPRSIGRRFVGLGAAQAGGLWVGKEGPLVTIGAGIGNAWSYLPKAPRLLHMPQLALARDDGVRREFVSSGAAAGVAAAFGAPIGALLFVFEEASSVWDMETTPRIFFSAMVSTFTLNVLQSGAASGWTSVNLSQPGLVLFGGFVYQPYSLWEVPVMLLLGVVGGLAGGIFNSLSMAVLRRRAAMERRFGRRSRAFEIVVLGVLTSLSTVIMPLVMDSCSPASGSNVATYQQFLCPDGYYSSSATLFVAPLEQVVRSLFHGTDPLDVGAMLAYATIFFGLLVVSSASAVPGGLFVPQMIVGATIGRSLGQLLQRTSGTYALIGAASLVAGSSRMSISLTVIFLELTYNIEYLLPLMVVIMTARLASGLISRTSLLDRQLAFNRVPFVHPTPPARWLNKEAGHLAVTPDAVLPEIVSLRQLAEVLGERGTVEALPIVRNDRFVGIVLRARLAVLITHRELWCTSRQAAEAAGQVVPASVRRTEFLPTLTSRTRRPVALEDALADALDSSDCYLNLRPFVHPALSVLTDVPLPRVFHIFTALSLRHLTVVDDEYKVLGIITRGCLSQHHRPAWEGTSRRP
jgi:chloride channel 7